MIICIDYDGTLCVDKYPDIGEPNLKVIDWVKSQRRVGAKLILWTCREGLYLKRAVDWCAKMGIEFDAVNENIPELKYSNSGQHKVIADIYLDDKALKVSDIDALPNSNDFQKGQ